MKKTKLEKGITLVALIITIVVLLILAVVSIGAVRNSGIIGHATNTSDAWKQAQAKESTDLKVNEDIFKEKITIQYGKKYYGTIDGNSVFVIFGSNMAKISYPDFNINVESEYKIENDGTIIRSGKEYTFNNVAYKKENDTYSFLGYFSNGGNSLNVLSGALVNNDGSFDGGSFYELTVEEN